MCGIISSSILTSGFHCASPVAVVNRHASHFSVFRFCCHFLLHLATLSVSFWILLCASSLSECEDAIAKSSAKALTSVSSPNSSRRSSINIMNSVGDRTAPCRRPHLNSLSLCLLLFQLLLPLFYLVARPVSIRSSAAALVLKQAWISEIAGNMALSICCGVSVYEK